MAQTFVFSTSATTAAPSNNNNYNYDVFINHRGPDVKKTLASHLYRRLLSYGFRAFLDQEELQAGDDLPCQIKGAIATASVHIAIFSPKYAESKWCLEELVLMLKSETSIIPVFYNVKPSDLRIRTGKGEDGVYGRALRDLEKKKRYEPNIVQIWRDALSRVADISGLELQACNGDEGELADKVLRLVQKMARKPPLDVATYPIGLDDKLEDFERAVLLQHHSREAKVAGIVGVGGVGKTTLAKQFFNRNRSDYDRSCFLFGVRDAAARTSLISLQSKLYEDLTGQNNVMNSIDEGIAMLRHHVPRSLVLVILDDVDSVEQLRVLFSPLKDVLSSGSLILVTSRNKRVLTMSGLKQSSIYTLIGLNREHSQQLFCLHAFHRSYPVVGFEGVVTEFLDVCQGLPLSLQVIGALLYLEIPDLQYWKDQLLKISKVLPTDIQSKLKISYDTLDEEEREMFLDIACFFIGEDRDKAIRIWDGSDWAGSIGFRNMENKSLVEVDRKNCIRMHDHLIDLGRALADKEPWRRLWRPTDDIFRYSNVRGINIDTSKLSSDNAVDIDNRFVDARGLQLLRVKGDWCERISNLVRRSNLLWLRWDISSFNRISEHVSGSVSDIVSSSDGFSSNSNIVSSLHRCSEIGSFDRPCRYSLPSWIPIKNLRVIEVVGCEIQLETLWQSESEAPLELRELNIIGADLLQLPKSIGQLKYLEKVELRYTVETLPEEFFHLCSLKHLRMHTGAKLLPNALGNLTNLHHLNLAGCYNLQMLPSSLGNLTNLQSLSLHGCSDLEILPHSFGNLVRLKHLCLKGCSQLTFCSESLGNIKMLESLDLSDCLKMEVLPPQVTYQWSLQKLFLWNTNLRELPSAIGNLSNLEILRVSSMETLPPSLGNLKSLKQFTLFGGEWKCLPDSFGELKQLTNLTIDCGKIEYLPAYIREFNHLEFLNVIKCPLREVPFARVGNVEGVKNASADLSECRLLNSSIHNCMLLRLKHLDLQGTRIRELSFAEGICPFLRQLDISDCLELVGIGALPKTLISLDLNGCDALKKVTGLCGLAKLRELDMRKCEEVEELPGLQTLISLVHLRISGCRKLKSIRGLAEMNFQIPESLGPHSDLIELKLFNDLRLRKERLHELQSHSDDFRRENAPQLEGEDINELPWDDENETHSEGETESETQSETQSEGETELETQSEGEDTFGSENETQSEMQSEGEEYFRSDNEAQSDGEDDFRVRNVLQFEADNFTIVGNERELHSEAEDFVAGNEMQLEGEEFFRRRRWIPLVSYSSDNSDNASQNSVAVAMIQEHPGHFEDARSKTTVMVKKRSLTVKNISGRTMKRSLTVNRGVMDLSEEEI